MFLLSELFCHKKLEIVYVFESSAQNREWHLKLKSTHIMLFSNDYVPQSQTCGIFGVSSDEWKEEHGKILWCVIFIACDRKKLVVEIKILSGKSFIRWLFGKKGCKECKGDVLVSSTPLSAKNLNKFDCSRKGSSVPKTQPAFIEWQSTIRRSLPASQNCVAKRQNQPLSHQ